MNQSSEPSLVQILLPLADNQRRPYPYAEFIRVRQELLDRFGGVTAQLRAPAEGSWFDDGSIVFDSIVIFEAMVQDLDPKWWADYRAELEARFRQHEVVVRAIPMVRL